MIPPYKSLVFSAVLVCFCQLSFSQSVEDKKPYTAPASPASVKPIEHKVTIVKNSETLISTTQPMAEEKGTTKYIDGKGPGVGEKVYTTEVIKSDGEILVPDAKPADGNPIVVPDNAAQPK